MFQNYGEGAYLDLLHEVRMAGHPHTNRTGIKTKRVISRTLRFDLSNNQIPVFTTKRIHWKSVVIELLWFLSGRTNIEFLQKHGVRIWNEWADEQGELGPVYGKQFRRQGTNYDGTTIDPLAGFIFDLKSNPDSRRHMISLWNGPEIAHMRLPPCHGIAIQASVIDGKLYLEMYQRSCDMFLGVPFNVASYSLFAHMVARECGLEAVEFIWHGHDCHVYETHYEAIDTQLGRSAEYQPQLDYKIIKGDMFRFLNCVDFFPSEGIMRQFGLVDYNPDPAIKAKVAV
jgi:thymidylate synthase